MKNKIILVIIGVLAIGAGLFFWYYNHTNPRAVTSIIDDSRMRPSVFADIKYVVLSVGGNFQSTKYTLDALSLTYDHSGAKGEQHSNVRLTSTDRANLDSIFAKYNLENLKSDSTPLPDMLNYYLVIAKDGKTYKLQFVSSQNPGYTLASELEKYFNQIKK